ncbi:MULTISPECIES: hypothetical protein [unclassified Pseudomonas]|nr:MULTISPECIES: hypothetical protein [unclassified Pseudomonas]
MPSKASDAATLFDALSKPVMLNKKSQIVTSAQIPGGAKRGAKI